MLLRVSGDRTDNEYNLEGILGHGDVGVPGEEILGRIAEAVFTGDEAVLSELRETSDKELSRQQLVDAFAVASGFNGITKVANATGLPLDDSTQEMTVEMRQSTGIDAYSEAAKSSLFD